MLPGSPAIFYKDPSNTLLNKYLSSTNGVLFPFQPKVDISFSANYQAQKVIQSNFTFYSYENSELKPFDLSCDFPVRNPYEGQYVIAALTFLRSLTMMFTGNDDNVSNNGQMLAGSPPMVVNLQGMGFGGLDSIPVAITNVTTSYPENIDYVTITMPGAENLANELIKVPTLMTISVTCTPMFSRQFASQFSAINFSTGKQRYQLLKVEPPLINIGTETINAVNGATVAPPTIEPTHDTTLFQLPTVTTKKVME
jgi:hypothetical protein